MNKEVKERLKSIISVLLFLGIATWYWYGPREELTFLAANMNKYYVQSKVKVDSKQEEIKLDNSNYDFTVTNKTNEIQNYEVILNNSYLKSKMNNCNIIQNNYIKYQLFANQNNLEEQNLSLDGVVYRGVLQPNETINFSIKLNIDKENLDKDECFFPVINAGTYYKI